VGALLDANALIALLADEPAAAEVDSSIRSGGAAMTAVNLAEAVDWLGRAGVATADEVRALVGPLELTIVPVDAGIGWRAGELRARHHRRIGNLSLADCILVAAATFADRVATSDQAVLALAGAEGIATLPLPDSEGRRP